MNILKNDFRTAVSSVWNKRHFKNTFDGMTSDIWFATEKESIEPENIEKTKKAFIHFLDRMNMPVAKWCFEELQAEKTGEFAFRADGKTPNWYHEFRECLYFLAMVRAGLIREHDLREFGSIEGALGIILRHDSWEDLGKNRHKIYSPLKEKILQLEEKEKLDKDEIYKMRLKALAITHGTDLLTRKTPKIDDNGEFVRKPSGKFVKIDRFGGQLHLYYTQLLKSPLTVLAKFIDGIEGMSTRVGVLDFSVDDDRAYTNERRMLYGRRRLDREAIEKYPFLRNAIHSADSMLGILLVSMETLNDYAPDRGQNPEYAVPVAIDDYFPAATRGFNRLPPAWHPISIFMERMRSKASREQDGRVEILINRALMPSLAPHFGHLNIYGRTSVLQELRDSAPTMQ